MMHKLSEEKIAIVVENGATYLANYCINNNLHYVVVGSSGGLDSAVTLAFADRACKKAAEINFGLYSVALIMPCQSCAEDNELGLLAAEKFNAKIIEIKLDRIFDEIIKEVGCIDKSIRKIISECDGFNHKQWEKSERVAQGNIKARLRMMLGAYHTAKMLNGLVLSTDNLSEFWMAFWTICGDVGDFGIIQQVMKGLELPDIARYLGVPEEIIKRAPSDGLGIAGNDADQLGAEYPVIDEIMLTLINSGFDPDGDIKQLETLRKIEGFDDNLVRLIAGRCLHGAYKRKGTIVLSRKQLGLPPLSKVEI
jgi:NAD+ synthase